MTRVLHRPTLLRSFTILAVSLLLAVSTSAQLLEPSGSFGWSFVYASDPAGANSQLFKIDIGTSATPIPIGAPVPTAPSRWAHRRRTLGALETNIAWAYPLVLMTPMGQGLGDGAIHLVDYRTGDPPSATLAPTGNPAGYDLAIVPGLKYVFSVEDTGAGTTRLRGYSWGTPGALVPLSPPTLEISGEPSAYTQRIAIDEAGGRLWVPTVNGLQEVTLSSTPAHMTLGSFQSTGSFAPTTNPVSFERAGTLTWAVGTCRFNASNEPVEAGYITWDASGTVDSGVFGGVPSAPSKSWVPAVGAEELAVVSDDIDTYLYYLLREPPPGTFFIKGSAVGCVRYLGGGSGDVGTLALTDQAGEPFANPAVSGARVAFETSFGPPFVTDVPDGGERIVMLYSPLDPLGASTNHGLIGIAGALAGRVSTKGMDRPIWSEDGTRVFAATSWFPGAPNPGVPGLEVLNVPAGVALNPFITPHTVVPTPDFADRSIIFPTRFDPRIPTPQTLVFDGIDFVGHVAHDGMASATATAYGEIGQKDFESVKLVQNTAIPNFPAILPPAFEDATASLFPIPDSLGARRCSYNFHPAYKLQGLGMFAADGDQILLQATSNNTFAELGLLPTIPRVALPLPTGWVTTTEIFSF